MGAKERIVQIMSLAVGLIQGHELFAQVTL